MNTYVFLMRNNNLDSASIKYLADENTLSGKLGKAIKYPVRLFDLDADPGETSDVKNHHPKLTDSLMESLQGFLQTRVEGRGATSLTEEEKRRLRSLGYGGRKQ